jgi:hypothetical protein
MPMPTKPSLPPIKRPVEIGTPGTEVFLLATLQIACSAFARIVRVICCLSFTASANA